MVFIAGHGSSERIEYSPYGTPKGFVIADQNLDGSVDSADYNFWLANFNAGNALGDVNFDSTLDAADS
ncbi:MAG TPA: hypothetical protein ENJ00_04005, partial [Phycisphaerales bacterium]|nr:hypothetical protein [Phycisphaerales bacterium]